MEGESEERDAMDWLEDDEMVKPWEGVSKEEEHITMRYEGRGLRTGKCAKSVPELKVSQAQMRRKESKLEKDTKKVVVIHKCWETSRGRVDLKTRRKWCSGWGINQEEVENWWKELCGKMEKEVLEKYRVEESKKSAYKGRGEPLGWRNVKK